MKNHRIPETQKEIEKQVDKLIRDDLIEPSVSPYNSPEFPRNLWKVAVIRGGVL